jgi:uncharacterized coiled-coil DUF342 family protein
MKKANEIEAEINQTASRIAQLQTELTEQTTTFESVQQSFVSGKTGVDELHAEQSKLTLLAQGLESLKAIYQRLKTTFEHQSAAERRAELLKQMATTANQVPTLVDEYLETRTEFHEIVADYAEKLISKGEAYRTKQLEYRAITNELQPTAAEIAQSGLAQRTRTMVAASHINHPPLEYGEVIRLTENLLAAKLNRAAQVKRTAKARQAAMSATNAGISKDADSALLEV